MVWIIDFNYAEIELTEKRWRYIVTKHPEVKPYKTKIEDVLKGPDLVKRSKHDKNIHLYYRFFPAILNGKYLLVVTAKRHKNFIVTSYITDRIKGGDVLWQKD